MRRKLARGLGEDGHVVEEVYSDFELLASLDAGEEIDLVISSGLDVLGGLRSLHRPEHWDTPVILIAAFGDDDTYRRAAFLNAAVFDKPFDVDRLRAFVKEVLDARS